MRREAVGERIIELHEAQEVVERARGVVALPVQVEARPALDFRARDERVDEGLRVGGGRVWVVEAEHRVELHVLPADLGEEVAAVGRAVAAREAAVADVVGEGSVGGEVVAAEAVDAGVEAGIALELRDDCGVYFLPGLFALAS